MTTEHVTYVKHTQGVGFKFFCNFIILKLSSYLTCGYHSEQCNSIGRSSGIEFCRIEKAIQEIIKKGNYFEFSLLYIDLFVLIWTDKTNNNPLLTDNLCHVFK